MLAPNNALTFRFGITNFKEWEFWVYSKSIGLEEGESEEYWIDRIMYTSDAILEQKYFIENNPSYTKSERVKEVTKLLRRLSKIIDVLGYIPSSEHIHSSYSDDKVKLTELGLYLKEKARQRSVSNLTKLVSKLLSKGKIFNTDDLWRILSLNHSNYMEKLVYIYSVSGNSPKSKLEWSPEKEGVVKTITKDSISKIISKEKIKIKNIKDQCNTTEIE